MEAILNNITQNFPTVKRISFKTCRKCKGQMGLTSDPDAGLVWECIQCGHEEYVENSLLRG